MKDYDPTKEKRNLGDSSNQVPVAGRKEISGRMIEKVRSKLYADIQREQGYVSALRGVYKHAERQYEEAVRSLNYRTDELASFDEANKDE